MIGIDADPCKIARGGEGHDVAKTTDQRQVKNAPERKNEVISVSDLDPFFRQKWVNHRLSVEHCVQPLRRTVDSHTGVKASELGFIPIQGGVEGEVLCAHARLNSRDD
jgi:hypothetical protein